MPTNQIDDNKRFSACTREKQECPLLALHEISGMQMLTCGEHLKDVRQLDCFMSKIFCLAAGSKYFRVAHSQSNASEAAVELLYAQTQIPCMILLVCT